ncbi:DUF2790 domain-containing protein [Pseudomonas huanghezhanensis]|uniref:DUF2790 domain-containing protein n=1 Tax=Pseudomonas huanghezhanensis TaxID=3002903 RepID=UPI0022866C05|nr:DUF2790 domain-containing protein [Pseudomonas sp. BSw22131]
MKYPTFIALSLFSTFASANGAVDTARAQPVPEAVAYTYSQTLDIAKVIDITTAADVATACGPVESHMVYLDSKGVKHNLEYTRLGDGCQSG